MKNLILISACLLSLMGNAQARIGSNAQAIIDEFQGEDIEFLNGEKGNAYILLKIDDFIEVYYYLREDSICTSTLIVTNSKEATDKIINNYNEKGYLKTDTGWLMRGNDIIVKINYALVNGQGLFYWE
jgi:hypothetical protein